MSYRINKLPPELKTFADHRIRAGKSIADISDEILILQIIDKLSPKDQELVDYHLESGKTLREALRSVNVENVFDAIFC